ncbi:Irregular chiasm C-roughest protein [Orchesella cincta]|uniref:Irregular chiasm C-roughest protein n=1 Tax=Orchesella cincta TaxID=48709 RepID=A0A1D2N1Q7_ORCCI|nr:Irregular chiasm C-roughest protein [Orchesella cincta]
MQITWIDGNGHEVKTGVESIKEPLDDGKRFNTRSILRFRPTKEHHNKTFTCQAHNRPSKEVMSTHIRLEVKYAPKVSVKIQSTQIREFDNVRISCRAEANPPEISYRWFLNDQVLAGDHGPVLLLPNVTRKYHDAIIKCEVQNAVGRSQENGPVFRNRPRDVQADLGASVTLSCDVDGNPPPIIVWIYQKTRAVVQDRANYTTTLTQDTQGKYICQAHVQGFPTISAEATIHLKGPPSIKSQRAQFGVEGDTVRLECLAESIPLPDKVTWTHLGREIDSHDSDYSVLEDNLPNGKRSVLVIRSSQEKDFGPYNCTVTNTYGSHIMEIYLMKQKSGQLVIILTCVIGGVVIIVALTMITLLCQKKTKKPVCKLLKCLIMEVDGVEKQTKQSDRSSNDSDLKVEIRTASSLSNIPEHDSEHWDEGSDAMKNESIYRYSDYIDPVFPPKHDGHNNNGYVPYVDYTRDYNPPHTRNSIYNGQAGALQSPPQYLNNVDPRYSATYGNPYLRTSNTSLPPPTRVAITLQTAAPTRLLTPSQVITITSTIIFIITLIITLRRAVTISHTTISRHPQVHPMEAFMEVVAVVPLLFLDPPHQCRIVREIL